MIGKLLLILFSFLDSLWFSFISSHVDYRRMKSIQKLFQMSLGYEDQSISFIKQSGEEEK